ncbi:FAD/NAD-P-binding domain-containing protein [Mycena metata]|uniref:FAD/NAD-P-binding domain-containing protein n=1 Tax=Mycena metata TaxID=1033252 RepID=A0AAD7JU12_9AGAR|nr:FAD/NAD-P-binding domain-containing protein [Mycena metata]
MLLLNLRRLLLTGFIVAVFGRQAVFNSSEHQWTTFPRPITRVAVIGAGPSGLQAAAQLLAANLSVRLFERSPQPGGTWHYTENTPAREIYPGAISNKTKGTPNVLPATIYYAEGEDGISLEDRWKEHWQPSPAWHDLHTNSPSINTELPGVKYPANAPWAISVHDVQRHVRAYASLHGINSNDGEPSSPSAERVASYSTRVEKVEKCNSTATWTLTLRHLKWLPETNRIKERFWTETFDAVVVATNLFTTPKVPTIKGIEGWSSAMEDGAYSMHHSQSYRHPERYAGKTVLIVGSSISATQIGRSIFALAHRVFASVRVRTSDCKHHDRQKEVAKFEQQIELVPEISFFEPLNENSIGIQAGRIHLLNGTILQGIDMIILATGYQLPSFFPARVEYQGSSVNPLTQDNLHWTGHYIKDPTLAYSLVRPWTHGRYQSTGFARVWTGKVRLPGQHQMWKEYKAYDFGSPLDVFPQEALVRKYVAWLNAEALELGGQFVEPLPVEAREAYAYFYNNLLKKEFVNHDNFTRFDGLPSNEWPSRVEVLSW